MSTIFDLLMTTMRENGDLSQAPSSPPVQVTPDPVSVKPFLALQKTGRRADGANRDHGKVVHAVKPGSWTAFCGTQPQGSGDWSAWESPEVTCAKCLKKVQTQSETPA